MRAEVAKKMFFIDSKGNVGRHKSRKGVLVGAGIIHKDQQLQAFTNSGRVLDIPFAVIKVGTHFTSPTVNLEPEEHILKIDIVTVKNG